MSLRRKIESNYTISSIVLYEDPTIIEWFVYENDCPDDTLGSIFVEAIALEDENFQYNIIDWDIDFKDEWPLRLIFECLKASLQIGDRVKVERKPLGFWESLGFSIEDGNELEVFYVK